VTGSLHTASRGGTIAGVHADWTQAGHRIRFDWGPDGAAAVAPGAALVAVVDVLSFTTTLSVAVERGIAVLPYRWRDPTAAQVARDHDAVLAVGRREAVRAGQVSLSPESVLRTTGIRRLVLPSPNGATVSARLADAGATVVGVSLRNADAAAASVLRRLSRPAAENPGRFLMSPPAAETRASSSVGPPAAEHPCRVSAEPGDAVAVVAAGERWPGGSLRPAVEDLWGAGAFIEALVRRGVGGLSVEASTALAAYRSVADDLASALRDCASGRELHAHGFPGDVEVAAQAGAGGAVPVLTDGWFVADS
jgi:2-phosphosulfolactate phosphatase